LASSDPDIYSKINDVSVEKVMLMSEQGGSVDLSDLVVQIDLYEDLASPVLKAQIKVVDAIGFRTHLPLSGTESVEISFRTPGIGSPVITTKLDVMSMTGRTKKSDDRSEIYELNLRSRNHFYNETRRVSRAYEGKISDMVVQIAQEYLPEVDIEVEETRGNYKFVIPNLRPIDAIRLLATKAVSAEGPHDSNYILFETLGSLVFASLGRLSRGKTMKSLHSKLSSIDDGTDKTRREFLKIQDIQVKEDFDTGSDLRNSMMSSRLMSHDLTTKSIKILNYNHMLDFDKSNHVEPNRELPFKSRYRQIGDGKTILLPRQENAFGDAFSNSEYESEYLKSLSTRMGWRGNSLLVTTAGDSTIRAGMVFKLSLPSNEPKTSNDPNWYDKYGSGRYLITSIRHSILNTSGKEYTNMIELSRDSLPVQLPDEKTFLGSSKGDDRNDTSLFA
jgi:hypothetical protein